MTLWYAAPQDGHSGVEDALKRLVTLFYWKNMRKEVKKFVQKCDVCQKNKSDLAAYPKCIAATTYPKYGMVTDQHRLY